MREDLELACGCDNLTWSRFPTPAAMKTHLRIRRLAWVIVLAGLPAATPAEADIYTWVDASGNLNLSNLAPPEGSRVTQVFREDPALRASAEAAHAATQREELRALSERVTQLERDLDAASHPAAPPVVYPPAAPAQVVYEQATPAPVPYPYAVAQTIVAPATPGYADCSSPWASCMSPGYFAYYPSSIVVVSAPARHRAHPFRRPQRAASPALPHFPMPVGALPDPVNLFPGVHRR